MTSLDEISAAFTKAVVRLRETGDAAALSGVELQALINGHATLAAIVESTAPLQQLAQAELNQRAAQSGAGGCA